MRSLAPQWQRKGGLNVPTPDYYEADEMEEVTCGDCNRQVNLYNEEIYHYYKGDGLNILVWQCKECSHRNTEVERG